MILSIIFVSLSPDCEFCDLYGAGWLPVEVHHYLTRVVFIIVLDSSVFYTIGYVVDVNYPLVRLQIGGKVIAKLHNGL